MLTSLALGVLGSAPSTWTLAVGGDVMLYGVDPKKDPFKEVAKTFSEADVAYANLEIPLTDSRTSTRLKSAAEIKKRTQFVLKAHPDHIAHLDRAGFDLLSLGNNHAMDYGWSGLKQTLDLLSSKRIAFSGAGANRRDAEEVAVKELPNGFRVGMISGLAFLTTGAMRKCGPAGADSPGIATFQFDGNLNAKAKQELARRVSQAKSKCDFLIIAPHWGIEKESRPRPWQIQLGRAMIDEGADAVLGAHPHVLQGRELYEGKPILYSTGNLISPLPARSAIYTLTFEGTKFKGWTVRPMRNRSGKVEWLPSEQEAAATREILRLDSLIPKSKSKAKSVPR